MALFKKKRTLDEILDDIKNLSPDEAKELHNKMGDLYKAEDEREIDKIEADKADTPEVADEKKDEVNEESEEIGKDVDEIKDDVATDEETAEVSDTHEIPDNDPETPATDDGTAELIKTLTDRVNGLEALVSELHELKEKMDEYVSKQKETFGYRSTGSDTRKNYDDMSADELKNHLLNN